MTIENITGTGEFFLLITISAILIVGFAVLISRRKSQDYRKQITDMYVAAKTRFLAKADGLDLTAEEESFKAWSKKERTTRSEYDLDRTIEEELKERVSEPVVKKKEPTSKKK